MLDEIRGAFDEPGDDAELAFVSSLILAEAALGDPAHQEFTGRLLFQSTPQWDLANERLTKALSTGSASERRDAFLGDDTITGWIQWTELRRALVASDALTEERSGGLRRKLALLLHGWRSALPTFDRKTSLRLDQLRVAAAYAAIDLMNLTGGLPSRVLVEEQKLDPQSIVLSEVHADRAIDSEWYPSPMHIKEPASALVAWRDALRAQMEIPGLVEPVKADEVADTGDFHGSIEDEKLSW